MHFSDVQCRHLLHNIGFEIIVRVSSVQDMNCTAVDAYELQLSKILIRRRALRAAPDMGIRYVSLHKAHFRR